MPIRSPLRETIALSILAAASFSPGLAQDTLDPLPHHAGVAGALDQSEALAAILEPIRARHKLPGLAAAIVSEGELREIAAVGVRRAGSEEGLTTGDIFHLGSCTKAMTATMIATLVEEGRLTWMTTIGEVFPDVEMHDDWKPITIEQLLHNRAGAPAHLNADGLWGRLWNFRGTPREARMALVRGTLKHPPASPGNFLYSNAGFAIAGAMAETITDTSWEELMRARLFEPLGMSSAGFGAPGTAERLDQPRGHHASGKPEDPGPRADNPVAIGPAGIVHCTLADWARFIALHTSGGKRDDSLVKPETIARLQTPGAGPGDKYAMGWMITTRPWARGEAGQGLAHTHAGSNTM